MLMMLGKRIERLFYVGILLLLTLFLEIYLVNANAAIASDLSASIHKVREAIESNKDSLSKLLPKTKEQYATENEEIKNINMTRTKLGISPKKHAMESTSYEPYRSALQKIVSDSTTHSENYAFILEQIDQSKSPSEITETLREQEKISEIKTVSMWGIVAPNNFSITYGNGSYIIPLNVIVVIIMLTVTPAIIAWMGSLYITRNRELLEIIKTDDLKNTFPHLLNIFPFTNLELEKKLNIKRVKNYSRQLKINFISCAVVRTVLLGFFCGPMVLVTFYCGISIFDTVLKTAPTWTFIFSSLAMLTISIQAIIIIIQESLIPFGKIFHE